MSLVVLLTCHLAEDIEDSYHVQQIVLVIGLSGKQGTRNL